MKFSLSIFFVFASFYSWSAFSAPNHESFKIDLSQSKGEVGFHAVGNPSALKINGKSKTEPKNVQGVIEITPDKVSGVVSFSLETLDTGIKLRDKHMKNKYLEVKQHPRAQFEVSQLKLPKDFFQSDKFSLEDVSFVGKFRVHGVVKEVQGKLNVRRENDKVFLQTQFPIKLSDHGIDVPSFMGVTVAQDVTVYTDLEADMVSVE